MRAGWDARIANGYNADFDGIIDQCDHICVVGGDGSLRDMAEKLSHCKNAPSLSIYPAGTINLVAREAQYPASITKFVARITAAQHRQHYHGSANGKAIVACASVGPDSKAVAHVSERLKRHIGRFAYAISFGRLLWQWPRNRLQVTADGKIFHGEAVYILKGHFFAGPWVIDPNACLTQPRFRILVMPTARRRDYLRLALSAAIHPIFADKAWHFAPAKDIKIEGQSGLEVQIDGDIAATLPLTARIMPVAVDYC